MDDKQDNTLSLNSIQNNYKQYEGGEFNDSEEVDEVEDEDEQPTKKRDQKPQAQKNMVGSNKKVEGQQLENQPYDLAVDVNDSEEIESEEEDDEVNMEDLQRRQPPPGVTAGAQTSSQSKQQKQNNASSAPGGAKRVEDDDDGEEEKEVPGTYNPTDFANLNVSSEVKDLFEYIKRYKPQKIDLETKLKPFIPDYIPAVGEVDACLKMPKPDGQKEDLGIAQLDEPALNCEDKTVLELKYVQSKNVVRSTPLSVDSIEHADKKPKEISRWINSMQELHKTRPPQTVSYSKQMPDFDQLMSEMSPEMEYALKDTQFPGADIDMHPNDYARIILAMLDIPVHKLTNNRSLIESLHVLFTLFSEFRQNQHFKNANDNNF